MSEVLLSGQRVALFAEKWGTNSQTVTIDFPITMRAAPVITLIHGENIEEITTAPTANCLLAYKNGDTSTMLGIYEFVADANL